MLIFAPAVLYAAAEPGHYSKTGIVEGFLG